MTGTSEPRFPLARAALVWAGLCALLLLVNAGNIAARRFPDPDDTLRLVQVRDLLAGQSWFDMHQYRIDPPHGTLMHWSRLVDLPLAIVIGLFTPLVGAGAAEMVALVAVPLLTFGVILLVVARIASRFFDVEVVTLACLSLGLAPMLVAQIQPMRIDHHGWQVACVMVALLGLLPGRGWRGAILSGIALAGCLTISLEAAPLMAGFGAVFGLRWLIARDHRSLVAFLASLTGSLVALFLATRGLNDLTTHCDTISPPHLVLVGITTALALATAVVRPRSPLALVVALGLAAGAGLAAFLLIAPQCAAGPFANLDPLVRHYWYENVSEGMPLWDWRGTLAIPVAVAGLIGLAALAHLALTRPLQERQWWLEYLAVAAVAYVAGLLVLRSQSFVGALSAVPLGYVAAALLERFRTAKGPAQRLTAGVVAVLVLLPSLPGTVAGALAPRKEAGAVTANVIAKSRCDFQHSVPRLNALPAATVFAPLDVGPAVLELSHHNVIATGHHRAALAMHDVIAAFTSSAEVAHDLIHRHGAQYLLLCADATEPMVYSLEVPGSFTARLLAGKVPAWLEPVDIGAPAPFKLWRVKA